MGDVEVGLPSDWTNGRQVALWVMEVAGLDNEEDCVE